MDDDVYHEGELAIQTLAGERAIAERHGKLVGDTILLPALPFLAKQPLVAAAAADEHGEVWCSVWCGAPGFVSSADARVVVVARSLDLTADDDPVRRLVRPGSALGLLAIELETRKRLRINGTITRVDGEAIELSVRESLPNCPKYIQKRRRIARESVRSSPRETGTSLDDARRELVARTDTMFVGSRHPTRGLDASHRGGTPGFLCVLDEATIRVPDYPGNSMFLTLGNLHVEPHAGLALVDFERGRVLAMTGTTRLHIGKERDWDFTVQRWIELDLPGAFAWELVERSPHNPL
jgi:predicted pyridoxine 5'-phosphate oxidase superfamily flavin-nucleotide-binding protein